MNWLQRVADGEKGCAKCGLCCMLHDRIPILDGEAKRINKRYLYSREIGGTIHKKEETEGKEVETTSEGKPIRQWYIKTAKREWAPKWVGDWVCIFLKKDRLCGIEENLKPNNCREWECSNRYQALTVSHLYIRQHFVKNKKRYGKAHVIIKKAHFDIMTKGEDKNLYERARIEFNKVFPLKKKR